MSLGWAEDSGRKGAWLLDVNETDGGLADGVTLLFPVPIGL